MKVVKTIMNGRPVKGRAMPRPAHTRRGPRPPCGSNFKFRELSAVIAGVRALKKNASHFFLNTASCCKRNV